MSKICEQITQDIYCKEYPYEVRKDIYNAYVKLRAYRIITYKTLQEMADLIGVNVTTYWKFENGIKVGQKALRKIMTFVGGQ